MSNLKHVTSDTFEAEVLGADRPVLVDFYAAWCGPCKMIAPVLDKLSDAFAGKVDMVKVDVDTEGALASRYRVTGVTLLLFDRGEVVWTQVGMPRVQDLWAELEKVSSVEATS